MELESKYVFILNGIVAGFFGINFILAPRMIMEMALHQNGENISFKGSWEVQKEWGWDYR